MSGKVAIITGGANGIGQNTAFRLAGHGAAVVVADRDIDGARAVVAQLGGPGVAVEFDAADASSVQEVIATTVKEFARVDVLHNNVGTTSSAWSTDLTVLETPVDVWDTTMAVNVRSHFVAAQAVLPHMLAAGGGSIINMASVAGQRGRIGLTAYGASKAAVIQLTRSLAAQYGRANIRSNCICPGVILTEQLVANAPHLEATTLEQIPYPRVGRPDDVAGLVAFLASEESCFINGEVIRCDGGASIGTDPRPAPQDSGVSTDG